MLSPGGVDFCPPPPTNQQIEQGDTRRLWGAQRRWGGRGGGGGGPAALAIILPLPSYKDKPKSTLLASFILTLVRDSPPVDWPTVYAGRGRGQAAAQLVLV